MKERRTAGSLAIVPMKVDSRISLASPLLMQVAEAGIETSQDSGGDLAHSQQGGAESGAVGTIAVSDDPR